MTVLPFLAIATVAGTLSLVLRSHRGWSTAIAVAGLLILATPLLLPRHDHTPQSASTFA